MTTKLDISKRKITLDLDAEDVKDMRFLAAKYEMSLEVFIRHVLRFHTRELLKTGDHGNAQARKNFKRLLPTA
jgi:hypothetical protein